jgi:hypothetical protein
MEQLFLEHFFEGDWQAHCRLKDGIKRICEDVAPAWLQVRVYGFAPALNGGEDRLIAQTLTMLHACLLKTHHKARV